jgi:predicted nucleic acid-binding protein
VIVLDTSILYALLDGRDRRHDDAVAWYSGVDEDLATTPLVLAETDHLAQSRSGPEAARAFRRDVRSGAYSIEWWPEAGEAAADVADSYEDLGLGLTDASLVVLADRLETNRIATFDERHFRTVRPLTGQGSFVLLPLDAN